MRAQPQLVSAPDRTHWKVPDDESAQNMSPTAQAALTAQPYDTVYVGVGEGLAQSYTAAEEAAGPIRPPAQQNKYRAHVHFKQMGAVPSNTAPSPAPNREQR